jgi:hypothetical protein
MYLAVDNSGRVQKFSHQRKRTALKNKKAARNLTALGISDVIAGPLPAACTLRQNRN